MEEKQEIEQIVEEKERQTKEIKRKPNLKSKFTVPQPFSLATEKRIQSRVRQSDSANFSSSTQKIMSSERLGSSSVNFKDSQPKLSKSISLNDRTRVEATKPRRVNSTVTFPATKTSCKIKVTTTEPAGDNKIEKGLKSKHKIQAKDQVESRYLLVTTKKQQGKEVDNKIKLGRSSTFKAPIPPSKIETKKVNSSRLLNFDLNEQMQATRRPKSPVIMRRGKSMSHGEKLKVEAKNKMSVSRTNTSHSAKETIHKMHQTTN